MAQNNIWNPNESFDVNNPNGQQPPAMPPQPSGLPPQVPSEQQQSQGQPGFDLNAWYQQTLGRPPDANESSSDMANIAKYGEGAFQQDFQKRLTPSGGGGGSLVAPGAGGPAGGDWYKGYFEDMRNRQVAADAERKSRSDNLYNTWLGRSQQATAVDRNDPNIRMQSDAYRANEDRASRNYISDLAESSGPLANLRGEQRMSAERVGQRTGAFEAELVGRELTNKRNEIAQALNAMGATLSADQQAGLQRELAIIDQSIKERGLDLQGRGLDIQGRAVDNDLERALMGNNQFYADLGLRAENQYNYWNDPLRTR